MVWRGWSRRLTVPLPGLHGMGRWSQVAAWGVAGGRLSEGEEESDAGAEQQDRHSDHPGKYPLSTGSPEMWPLTGGQRDRPVGVAAGSKVPHPSRSRHRLQDRGQCSPGHRWPGARRRGEPVPRASGIVCARGSSPGPGEAPAQTLCPVWPSQRTEVVELPEQLCRAWGNEVTTVRRHWPRAAMSDGRATADLASRAPPDTARWLVSTGPFMCRGPRNGLTSSNLNSLACATLSIWRVGCQSAMPGDPGARAS